RPPRLVTVTLFPYTTLFRSARRRVGGARATADAGAAGAARAAVAGPARAAASAGARPRDAVATHAATGARRAARRTHPHRAGGTRRLAARAPAAIGVWVSAATRVAVAGAGRDQRRHWRGGGEGGRGLPVGVGGPPR